MVRCHDRDTLLVKARRHVLVAPAVLCEAVGQQHTGTRVFN